MGIFTNSFFDDDDPDKRRRDRMNGTTPEYKTLIPQEDEGSALRNLGANALSGLALVGSTLDKYSGARAVRGILGGKPEEALSIIPFSDMAGLTKPENAVSGEQLNKQFFGGSDDGLMSTLGGIGTEILLDPTTYLTLGGSALTKAGAKLSKYGYNPAKNVIQATKGLQNLDELKWLDNGNVYKNLTEAGIKDPAEIASQFLNQPLGGPIGAKIPFMKDRWALTGEAGKKLANAAASVGDAASGAYSYAKSLPVIGDIVKATGEKAGVLSRGLGGMFNSRYNNAVTPEGQSIMKVATADELPNLAMSRIDKNLLRNELGADVKYPELLRWAVESGPEIKTFNRNPAMLSLNTSLAASMNDALRDIKSSHQDLAGLTDSQLLLKAENIYNKAKPFVKVSDETTGIGMIARPSYAAKQSNALTSADSLRYSLGGSGTYALDDVVHMGDGSEIIKPYFPRYANPVSNGRLTAPARIVDASAATEAALSTERTLKGLPQGATDIERMAKDPEITGLYTTSNPRTVAADIDKSAEKIALNYLKFPDAATYARSKNDLYEIKKMFGDNAIDDLKQNRLGVLSKDTYDIIKDANAVTKEIARQEGAKVGLTADDWLQRYTPSNIIIKDALKDPARYNIPKYFSGYADPRVDLLIDPALNLRSSKKLSNASDQLISALPEINPTTRSQILAADNAANIAETMAKQSVAHLPAGVTMPAGKSLTSALDVPKGAPFYGHILDSLESRILASNTGATKTKAVFDELLNTGLKNTDVQGTTTFGNALKSTGINADRSIASYADRYYDTNRFADVATNPLPATVRAEIQAHADDLLVNRRQSLLDDFEELGNLSPTDKQLQRYANQLAFKKVFSDLRVPQSTVNNINAEVISFKLPKPLGPIMKMFDEYTNLTKGGLTIIAPGFHGRNLISGLTTNIASGSAGTRPWEVVNNAYQADKAASGGVIEGITNLPLFKQINSERAKNGLGLYDDVAATKRFNELLHEYGVISPHTTSDLVVEPAQLAEKIAKQIPGEVPVRSASSLAKGFWDVAKPNAATGNLETNFKNLLPMVVENGQLRSNMDNFAPFTWGRDVNQKIEGANRGGAFLGFLKQGYTPEQAARMVNESHVDYSALTSFEKNVMKRAIPFYTFTKNMAPFVVRDITEHPGGLMAQYAKTAGRMRSQDENTALLPTHLGSSMLYDTTELNQMLGGVKPEGTRTFFTGLDLPVDVVAQYASNPFSQNQAFRGLESILGATNPLFKGPLELATNRQFFGHRNLDDLYSPTGSRILDQLLMNSPLSRIASMGKTLVDERKDPLTKALNLTLGGRFTDVDTQKWMNLRAKELIKEQLTGTNGIGTFEKIYARPDKINELNREQIELLRLQRNMENNALLYKKKHPELYKKPISQ
jgi:hypothetical protein